MGERFQECKQGADLAGKLLGKPCCDSGWYGVHAVYYLYGRGSSKDDHFDLSVLYVPRKYCILLSVRQDLWFDVGADGKESYGRAEPLLRISGSYDEIYIR